MYAAIFHPHGMCLYTELKIQCHITHNETLRSLRKHRYFLIFDNNANWHENLRSKETPGTIWAHHRAMRQVVSWANVTFLFACGESVEQTSCQFDYFSNPITFSCGRGRGSGQGRERGRATCKHGSEQAVRGSTAHTSATLYKHKSPSFVSN